MNIRTRVSFKAEKKRAKKQAHSIFACESRSFYPILQFPLPLWGNRAIFIYK